MVSDKFLVLRMNLRESSKSNRNYSLYLMLLATYILITTLSIKDIKVLFPELGVKMPLFNIDINLTLFAILAPILLTIFYINQVLKFNKHIELIQRYKKEYVKEKVSNIYLLAQVPFLLDFAYFEESGKLNILYSLLVYIAFLLYVPLVIFYMLYRFLDFYNIYISGIAICMLFILFYFLRLFINKTVESIFYLLIPSILIILSICFILFLYFGDSRDNLIKNQNFLFQSKYIPRVVISSAFKLPIPDLKKYDEYLSSASKLINIEINNSLSINTLPSINFNDRVFKFCNIKGVFLPFLNTNNSSFFRGIIHQSYLVYANFKKIDLGFSDLWRSNLSNSSIYDCNLSYSFNWGTNYYNTKIVKSDFSHALLWDTNFSHTNLLNVDFSYADLTKTDFSNSHFKNVDFSYAVLFKVDLTDIKIKNVKFKHTIVVETKGKIARRLQSNNDYEAFFLATKDKKNFSNDIIKRFYRIAINSIDKDTTIKVKKIILKYFKYWIYNKRHILIQDSYIEIAEIRKWVNDKRINDIGLTISELNQLLENKIR